MASTRPVLITSLAAILMMVSLNTPAQADSRADIINYFAAQATGPANPAKGAKLYSQAFNNGKPDTPSCTTCHGKTPKQEGQTRTGKTIAPMAVSQTPDRFTDLKKVNKWFGRNCKSVIGRECTAQEKVDFLTYLSQQ
ncbi:MAG: DUF1924 domain-containing protein [Magnetovibrio sp.]|nr:DUF1924 domain-containing protein [Magnetovibrio sp.]